jgi:hypothetical protein
MSKPLLSSCSVYQSECAQAFFLPNDRQVMKYLYAFWVPLLFHVATAQQESRILKFTLNELKYALVILLKSHTLLFLFRLDRADSFVLICSNSIGKQTVGGTADGAGPLRVFYLVTTYVGTYR